MKQNILALASIGMYNLYLYYIPMQLDWTHGQNDRNTTILLQTNRKQTNFTILHLQKKQWSNIFVCWRVKNKKQEKWVVVWLGWLEKNLFWQFNTLHNDGVVIPEF